MLQGWAAFEHEHAWTWIQTGVQADEWGDVPPRRHKHAHAWVGRLLRDDQARMRRNEHRGWNGYRDGAVHQPIHDGRRRGRGRSRVLVAPWPHHGDSRLASRVAWSGVSVPRGVCIALGSRPNTMGFVNKARRRCAPSMCAYLGAARELDVIPSDDDWQGATASM
jgi:hypothetical protein